MPVPDLLRIDHIPVLSDPNTKAAKVFENLGFICSPECEYRSPQYPQARWRSNCVFFEHNWIDLLQNKPAIGSDGLVVGGCLYRCEQVDQALARFPDERVLDRYVLLRRFRTNSSIEKTTIDIAHLAIRSGRVNLSLAGYSSPVVDIHSDWLKHPNGAKSIFGIDVVAESKTVLSDPVGSILDLSAIKQWTPSEFTARFGPLVVHTIVRIAVADLSQTRGYLSTNHHAFATTETGIVLRDARLKFAIEFTEAENP